jgi:hypothetical protein
MRMANAVGMLTLCTMFSSRDFLDAKSTVLEGEQLDSPSWPGHGIQLGAAWPIQVCPSTTVEYNGSPHPWPKLDVATNLL